MIPDMQKNFRLNAIRKEAAERSDTQTKWIIGAVVAAVIIIIGVLG